MDGQRLLGADVYARNYYVPSLLGAETIMRWDFHVPEQNKFFFKS